MRETPRDRRRIKSTVIIVNPKHFAVGLYFKTGETPLPKITVKGVDKNAQKIINIAQMEGIPVVEDAKLARSLHMNGQDDDFVPPDLLPSVAAVLRWVYQFQDKE